MSNEIDEKLNELFESICDSFYWEGADPKDVRETEFPEWRNQVKAIFSALSGEPEAGAEE